MCRPSSRKPLSISLTEISLALLYPFWHCAIKSSCSPDLHNGIVALFYFLIQIIPSVSFVLTDNFNRPQCHQSNHCPWTLWGPSLYFHSVVSLSHKHSLTWAEPKWNANFAPPHSILPFLQVTTDPSFPLPHKLTSYSYPDSLSLQHQGKGCPHIHVPWWRPSVTRSLLSLLPNNTLQ